MDRLLEKDDDPYLSAEEHDELGALLARHALATAQPALLAAVQAELPLTPLASSGHRVLLLAYAQQVVGPTGRPLPDILNHSFLHTLHDGLESFLVHHPVVVEKVKREELVRLVAGLRTLILKAVLLNTRFQAADVQGLMRRFLPTLPLSPANRAQWADWAALLHLPLPGRGDQPGPVLTMVDRSNRAMTTYFSAQLKQLARVRKPDEAGTNTDWAMVMWDTIKPKLENLLRVVVFLLQPTHPTVHLRANRKAKAQLLATRLGPEAGEQELVNFWNYLCDLRQETKFWQSGFVQGRLGQGA
jgi:hypothetical protein